MAETHDVVTKDIQAQGIQTGTTSDTTAPDLHTSAVVGPGQATFVQPLRLGPPISLQRQAMFWLGALLAFGLAIYAFSGILLPFVAGLVLAYFLDPLADRLERLGMSRSWATVVILGVFVMLFVVALLVLVPLLVSSMADFLALVPDYASKLQRFIVQRGQPIFERFGKSFEPPDLSGSIGDSSRRARPGRRVREVVVVGQPVRSQRAVADRGHPGGGVLPAGRLGPHDREGRQLGPSAPPRAPSAGLASEVNGAISGFIRGQALVCLILGTWYAVGLWLTGLNFGFLIGMIAGFLTFIPYVGSLTGLVLVGRRGAGAVLAGLGDDLRGARDLLHRAVCGGEHPVAQAGG